MAMKCWLIKRLTITKWKSTHDVLIITYKIYIVPMLEYGSEVSTMKVPPKHGFLNALMA